MPASLFRMIALIEMRDRVARQKKFSPVNMSGVPLTLHRDGDLFYLFGQQPTLFCPDSSAPIETTIGMVIVPVQIGIPQERMMIVTDIKDVDFDEIRSRRISISSAEKCRREECVKKAQVWEEMLKTGKVSQEEFETEINDLITREHSTQYSEKDVEAYNRNFGPHKPWMLPAMTAEGVEEINEYSQALLDLKSPPDYPFVGLAQRVFSEQDRGTHIVQQGLLFQDAIISSIQHQAEAPVLQILDRYIYDYMAPGRRGGAYSHSFDTRGCYGKPDQITFIKQKKITDILSAVGTGLNAIIDALGDQETGGGSDRSYYEEAASILGYEGRMDALSKMARRLCLSRRNLKYKAPDKRKGRKETFVLGIGFSADMRDIYFNFSEKARDGGDIVLALLCEELHRLYPTLFPRYSVELHVEYGPSESDMQVYAHMLRVVAKQVFTNPQEVQPSIVNIWKNRMLLELDHFNEAERKTLSTTLGSQYDFKRNALVQRLGEALPKLTDEDWVFINLILKRKRILCVETILTKRTNTRHFVSLRTKPVNKDAINRSDSTGVLIDQNSAPLLFGGATGFVAVPPCPGHCQYTDMIHMLWAEISAAYKLSELDELQWGELE